MQGGMCPKIYRHDGYSFVLDQSSPTSAAHGVEALVIGGAQFLAVADRCDGKTYDIGSKIYRHDDYSFVLDQSSPASAPHGFEALSLAARSSWPSPTVATA